MPLLALKYIDKGCPGSQNILALNIHGQEVRLSLSQLNLAAQLSLPARLPVTEPAMPTGVGKLAQTEKASPKKGALSHTARNNRNKPHIASMLPRQQAKSVSFREPVHDDDVIAHGHHTRFQARQNKLAPKINK